MRDYRILGKKGKKYEGDIYLEVAKQYHIMCIRCFVYQTKTHTHKKSIINIYLYVAVFIKEISSLLTFYSEHDRFVVCLMCSLECLFESNTIAHGCRITCACELARVDGR